MIDSNMEWRLHEGSEFKGLYERWIERLESPEQLHPLLAREFIFPLQRLLLPDSARVLCATRNDQVEVLFLVSKRRLGIWQSAYTSQLPITPLFSHVDVLTQQALEGAMVALGGAAQAVEFLHYDGTYLPAIAEGKDGHTSVARYGTTISIPRGTRFEDYWQSRPKKLRDNLKRYAKKVAQGDNEMRLAENRTPDAIDAAFTRYAEMETAGWKGQAGTAISTDNEQGKFYREMLTSFAERGAAGIFELYFDDTLVSSRIAIESGELVVFLKTTYAEQFSKLSPGRLLLRETLKQYLERDEPPGIEFYTNADRDMLQWGAAEREIVHVTCFRSALIQRLKKLVDRLRSNV